MVKAALPPATIPVIDRNGYIDPDWYQAFIAILNRTGGTAVDLVAESLRVSTTGFVVATTGAPVTRTLTAGTGLGVTHGDGQTANPVYSLANTVVTPGTYGDASHVGRVTVDQQGRLTAASSVAIAFPADAVTSVFGRIGAVVAASNDYSFAQISGTAAVPQGGTGAVTLAANGILYGSGTSAIAALAVNSTATKKYLQQISSGAPTWQQVDPADLSATPGFSAYLSAATSNDKTGDATLFPIVCDTEEFDNGSNYASGIFTAPTTGPYYFEAQGALINLSAGHTGGFIQFTISSGSGLAVKGDYGLTYAIAQTGFLTRKVTLTIQLTAGDTVQPAIRVDGSTKTVGVFGSSDRWTRFSGRRLY